MTAKRVFLAATGQNRGKTTTSLGLLAAIRERGLRVGFVKPVGQRYLVVDGTRADEDAVLMSEVFGLPDALDDMSPVTLPRHFTTDYVMGRVERRPRRAGRGGVRARSRPTRTSSSSRAPGTPASARWSASRTRGSPRCSTRRSSSSARAASAGRSTRSCSTARLFAAHGVEVLGAVVNKVDVESHPHLPEVLERGLGQHGVELLGCIPYSEFLANPSLELVATHLDGELLAGEATPGQTIGWVAIGAMQATTRSSSCATGRCSSRPATARTSCSPRSRPTGRAAVPRVIGIVLTGGFRPPRAVLEALREAGIFAYLVRTDTYRTAQAVDEILVKTHSSDTEKIATIIELVDGALDVDALLARL